jgi:flagellar basal body L-ring protein FlgH
MNRFIKSLFYYNSDDEDIEVSNNTKINAGGSSGSSSSINTNITYTIPPYQYNRIYAYPRGYK